MKRAALITATLGASLLVSTARADVLRVPGDYSDIDSAVQAASSGDEIVIAPGTYRGPGNRNISFLGKRLTVRSSTRNPADVVIDVDRVGRAFILSQASEAGSVFEGLHIVDGERDQGGAMSIERTSVEIIRCHFTNNTATSWGGAIWVQLASARIVECRFRANRAEAGGAILCTVATAPGLVLDRCQFLNNFADDDGAAVVISNAGQLVANCLFSGNEAGDDAGALLISQTDRVLVANCVFSRNTAADVGGGIVTRFGAEPAIVNSILWGNEDRTGTGETAQIHAVDDIPLVAHSCVQGGWTGGGVGNIATDPLLVDADGPDDDPGTLDDDCRLRLGSPCIDAGLSMAVAFGLDLAGNRRIVDGQATEDTGFGFPRVVDMGAYELGSGDPCPGDVDGDAVIDFDDLLAVLGGWGPCP